MFTDFILWQRRKTEEKAEGRRECCTLYGEEKEEEQLSIFRPPGRGLFQIAADTRLRFYRPG
jgi:hypothetical protein